MVRVARTVGATLARLDAKRWRQIGGGAALLAAVLLTARAVRDDREEQHGNVLERFRAAVTSKVSRVIVTTEGIPAGAILEVREGDRVLLHEPALTGLTFRLPPGSHDLSLALTGPGGLDLHKSIDVDVDARAAYALRVSVASWPWKRLAADWQKGV
jgi:hypothetical protein